MTPDEGPAPSAGPSSRLASRDWRVAVNEPRFCTLHACSPSNASVRQRRRHTCATTCERRWHGDARDRIRMAMRAHGPGAIAPGGARSGGEMIVSAGQCDRAPGLAAGARRSSRACTGGVAGRCAAALEISGARVAHVGARVAGCTRDRPRRVRCRDASLALAVSDRG
jgi:hypothetical protein